MTDDEMITHGTGNVFADPGYADAEERQTKLRLAHALNEVIARRRLRQATVANMLGVNQPKISALAHYRLDGFSVERLMVFLTALDQDVEIVNAYVDFVVDSREIRRPHRAPCAKLNSL